LILDDVASLDAVASALIWARFTNAGQSCAAIKRVFISKRLHDPLMSLLQQKMFGLKLGSPNQAVHLGPVISSEQRERLWLQLEACRLIGATIVTHPQTLSDDDGFYFAPTLVSNLPLNARILQEETFGPILPVCVYSTVEEAVQMINRHPLALSASVFGAPSSARKIAGRLHCGMVAINDLALNYFVLPHLPWQGLRDSGPGTSHGPEVLKHLSQAITVSENKSTSLPGFQKSPWLFLKHTTWCDTRFSKALVRYFAPNCWFRHCHPVFLIRILQQLFKAKL
jgi:succinate-semialdehyde dehydrogenase/glutarate-semialdehyde dehydrogenase